MTWSFERIEVDCTFTEGPVWDGEGVLFSDIPNNRIMRYVPATDEVSVYLEGTGAANGLKLNADGELFGCEMNGRRVVRYDGPDSRTVVADAYEGERLNSPNDLCFDSDGNLWFTDPLYATDWLSDEPRTLGHESVYRCEPTGPDTWSIRRMTRDTTRPNGLLVSRDGSHCYVAQSKYDEDYCHGGKRELRGYPIRTDAPLGEPQVLHNFYPHRAVDGMASTDDGAIVACAGWPESGPGPMLYVFAPNGRVLATHPYPVGNPTNCCFAGPELSTLYVTDTQGRVYRAETDLRGALGPPSTG